MCDWSKARMCVSKEASLKALWKLMATQWWGGRICQERSREFSTSWHFKTCKGTKGANRQNARFPFALLFGKNKRSICTSWVKAIVQQNSFLPQSCAPKVWSKSRKSAGPRKQGLTLMSRKGAWSDSSCTEEHCGLIVWEDQGAFSWHVGEQWFSSCL